MYFFFSLSIVGKLRFTNICACMHSALWLLVFVHVHVRRYIVVCHCVYVHVCDHALFDCVCGCVFMHVDIVACACRHACLCTFDDLYVLCTIVCVHYAKSKIKPLTLFLSESCVNLWLKLVGTECLKWHRSGIKSQRKNRGKTSNDCVCNTCSICTSHKTP